MVTYATLVCDYWPLNDKKYIVHITIGGDRLPYQDDASSPTTDLLETKILINSTISDIRKEARFIYLDIKDHFLVTLIEYLEYMHIKYKYIPDNIKAKYNIDNIVTDDKWVYIKI